MSRKNKITPEKIALVKNMLPLFGVNEISRQLCISKYTVSCIKAGVYDTCGPIKYTNNVNVSVCPITGFPLSSFKIRDQKKGELKKL